MEEDGRLQVPRDSLHDAVCACSSCVPPQVALCEEGAVQPAKYTDLMTELQVETAVATECSMFQSRDDCLSALDGTCDWRPDLEFSQDPRSCVLKGITFDTTQTRLALHECAATITSSLAHFRYATAKCLEMPLSG